MHCFLYNFILKKAITSYFHDYLFQLGHDLHKTL